MGINCYQIKKSFSGREVIRNFTFEAPSGQITILVGPNGCGKTTWINIALQLLQSDNGIVRYDDKEIGQVRDKVAVVYDETPIVKYLSGYDNLSILSGKTIKDEGAKEVLRELEITDSMLKMKGKAFSFGQRHKLAVAAALIREPEYFFLDEPAVGLDLESWERVSKTLIEQARRGSSIVVTGHNYDLLEEIADNIVIVKNGTVYFSGTKEQLLESGSSLKEIYRGIFMDGEKEN